MLGRRLYSVSLKKNVAVLDFGSSKITLVVGNKIDGHLNIIASGESDYAGFMDGEFIQPNLLKDAVKTALDSVQFDLKTRINKLYVGVPAEFCYNMEKELSLNLTKRTLITQKQLDRLFYVADDNILSTTHTIINKAPMYYTLDDCNKTSQPIGCYATSIKARTCFILVENQFIYLIKSIMNDLRISDYEFLGDILAQGHYLLSPEERNKGCILVDCGYITTSVSYLLGEGIVDLKSFSLGGALITSDISEILKLPFRHAESVKRQIILTLQATGLDTYDYMTEKGMEKVNAGDANRIALARIEQICDTILSCIENFTEKPNDFSPIYLTGGGLSYMRGIEYILEKNLDRKIKIVKPRLKYSKPDLSSVISLLDTAITIDQL